MYVYMHEDNLALNYSQAFICHKTQPNQTDLVILEFLLTLKLTLLLGICYVFTSKIFKNFFRLH